ncbi:hypothetical protein BH24ACT12_BH24ACT12_24600 [soil metagenome]
MSLTKHIVPAVCAAVAAAGLSACQGGAEAGEADRKEPAVVEPVAGSTLSRVTVTEQAAERLGLTTVPVRDSTGRGESMIPYGALLYDAAGHTWAYVETGRHTYVRERLNVAAIEGDDVYLRSGPADGEAVVSVGAIELYGAEVGIDH